MEHEYTGYTPPTPPLPYPTERREFRFAAAMAVCAFCLVNFIRGGGFNLGFATAACLSIILSAGYLAACGKKGTPYSRAVLALCLIIAAGFGRSNDGYVGLVMLLFLLVGVNLGLCLTAGQNRRDPGSALSLLDAGRSLFSMGFGKISPSLRGIEAYFRTGPMASRRAGAVLLGAVIAVPVLAVMIPLLIRADAAFDGLISLLPEINMAELAATALWGSLLFPVLYSRGVALNHHDGDDRVFLFGWQLHPLTVNTLLGAVCLVYVCYLASQLAYFVGGFSGILPEGYSPSEYARRGFFEMAWLCAINLGIIAFAMGLLDKDSPTPLSTKLACLFIGVVSLFFVASSVAKMALYIGVYGLTRLRMLTMVIMVFFAVTVSLLCLWLFRPKLPYMKTVVLTGLILGAFVFWLDVDTQVARYNVDAYLSGTLTTVDTRHLATLGDGAVPSIARLLDVEDPIVSEWARTNLINRSRSHYTVDFRGWNQIHHSAQHFLQEWTPEPPQS